MQKMTEKDLKQAEPLFRRFDNGSVDVVSARGDKMVHLSKRESDQLLRFLLDTLLSGSYDAEEGLPVVVTSRDNINPLPELPEEWGLQELLPKEIKIQIRDRATQTKGIMTCYWQAPDEPKEGKTGVAFPLDKDSIFSTCDIYVGSAFKAIIRHLALKLKDYYDRNTDDSSPIGEDTKNNTPEGE